MFRIKVNSINLYPLGGITRLNIDLNVSLYKELLILLGGPIFQFNSLILLKYLFPMELEMINYYFYGILLFNLLPIYPLDGGRILNLLVELFTPYKLSIKISILISYFSLLIIFLINSSNNIILMIMFLLVLIIKEEKKIDYIYHKFILERYLNNYRFKKTKIISNKDNFYRNKKHIIRNKNRYYYEKEYLSKILKKY